MGVGGPGLGGDRPDGGEPGVEIGLTCHLSTPNHRKRQHHHRADRSRCTQEQTPPQPRHALAPQPLRPPVRGGKVAFQIFVCDSGTRRRSRIENVSTGLTQGHGQAFRANPPAA